MTTIATTPPRGSLLQSYGTVAIGGAVFGGGLALLAGALTRVPAASIASRVLVAGGAMAGAAMLVNAITGGGLGTTVHGMTVGQRHQAAFAVAHLGDPGALRTAKATYDDTRAMQHATWDREAHIDDGIDAIRHSWSSALLTARLIEDHDTHPEAATQFVLGLGDAHERDGVDNTAPSAEMDRHNNAVGARIGRELVASLGRVPTGEELLARTLEIAGSGELLVVDNGELRATRPGDVPEVAGP